MIYLVSKWIWKVALIFSGLGFLLITLPVGFLFSLYGWMTYKDKFRKRKAYSFWRELIVLFKMNNIPAKKRNSMLMTLLLRLGQYRLIRDKDVFSISN